MSKPLLTWFRCSELPCLVDGKTKMKYAIFKKDVFVLYQSDNYKTAEYWQKLHATVLQHHYIDQKAREVDQLDGSNYRKYGPFKIN